MHDPNKVHWQVARCILRYILGNVDVGWKFKKSNIIDCFIFGYIGWNRLCFYYGWGFGELAMYLVVDNSSVHYGGRMYGSD